MRNFVILLALLFCVPFVSSAQKGKTFDVVGKAKGRQPHWVNWSKGKTFKKQRGKNKGIEGGRKFLFVVEVEKPTPPFQKSDVFSLADLQGGTTIAKILATQVEEAIASGVKIDGDKREEFMTKAQSMKAKGNFSGSTSVADYWMLVEDKKSKKRSYIVYKLMSISEDRLMTLVDQISARMGLPEEVATGFKEKVENSEEPAEDDFGF